MPSIIGYANIFGKRDKVKSTSINTIQNALTRYNKDGLDITSNIITRMICKLISEDNRTIVDETTVDLVRQIILSDKKLSKNDKQLILNAIHDRLTKLSESILKKGW